MLEIISFLVIATICGTIVGPLLVIILGTPVGILLAAIERDEWEPALTLVNGLWFGFILMSYACAITLLVHALGGGFVKWVIILCTHFIPLNNFKNSHEAQSLIGINIWVISFFIFFFSRNAAEFCYDHLWLPRVMFDMFANAI